MFVGIGGRLLSGLKRGGWMISRVLLDLEVEMKLHGLFAVHVGN